MAQHSGTKADTRFEGVWRVPDDQVASGRIPGYGAAVRIGGQVRARAGGRTAVEPGSAPMREDTLFRIASVTKPVGAVLVLSLVQDGVLDLYEPVARWLPEAASPRVLADPAGSGVTSPADRRLAGPRSRSPWSPRRSGRRRRAWRTPAPGAS